MELRDRFPLISLTKDQFNALVKLEQFLSSDNRVFMLKGYAGTGKTTILKGLTNHLQEKQTNFFLMAPTGRAAKVLRDQTGREAFTIHKSIYSYEDLIEVQSEESFYYYYGLKNNRDCINTIFIIDEASMVSDAKNEGEFFRFGSGHLLSDLMAFARPNEEGTNNKLIFVGDPAQLPPIGDSHSKAFDPSYLQNRFGLVCDEIELKEVKRQTAYSGILDTATNLRKCISSGFYNNFSIKPNAYDIQVPAAESFLTDYFKPGGTKVIIAYKNKTCLHFNLQIRSQKYGPNAPTIEEGEIVIIGANNGRKDILNGEFAVVTFAAEPIHRTVNLKGKKPVNLTWRKVKLAFPEKDDQEKIVAGHALENFITGGTYLSPDEMQALYVDFKIRHPHLKSKSEEFKKAISTDEFFNCILLKYGYAVTCHKAQGGEWDSVYIVWDYQNDERSLTRQNRSNGMSNETFFRWAYTAMTRAARNLISLDPPTFNSYSTLSIISQNAQQSLSRLTGKPQKTEREVHLDDQLLHELTAHGLADQPIPIQDHFLNVLTHVQPKYIDVQSWQKNGYEIWYSFQRESQVATIKTWVNSKGVFNHNYQHVSGQTNSNEFLKEVLIIIKELPNVHVQRTTAQRVIKKIEFDLEVEEQFPFTKSLFDDLERQLQSNSISITDVQHLSYKERYTFSRNGESAFLDFEYNGKGFFTRVLEVPNRGNSDALLAEVYTTLMTLETDNHASS